MNKRIIDISKLDGEDLFHYLAYEYEDKEYSKLIKLLPFAVGSIEDSYKILKELIESDKSLIAVYSKDKINTKNLQYIGVIPDGELYIG